MRKAMITKAFVGSLVGSAGAVVLFLVAGGLAVWNDSLIMNGPDVVGIRPDPFGWVMIGLAGMAVLVMVGAAVGLFIAWIGAVLNTANLADKTWLSFSWPAGSSVSAFSSRSPMSSPDPTGSQQCGHPKGRFRRLGNRRRQRPPWVLLKSRT